MRRGASLGAFALGMILAQGPPGCGASTFLCESDEGCAGLSEGQCEADGHCSVPDPECRSGRRYADHSGGLSGRCVGEDATGTSGDPSTDSAPASSGDDRTSLDDDASTTSTSSTSTTSSSTSTTDDPTDPTAEPPPGVCKGGQALVDEPFDGPDINPMLWEAFIDPGLDLVVLDGELRVIAVAPTQEAEAGLDGNFELPVVGSVGVELSVGPSPEQPSEVFVELDGPDLQWGFLVTTAGELVCYISDGFGSEWLDARPYDPRQHRWLQMTFDRRIGAITWQAAPSVDAGAWETLVELELQGSLESASFTFWAELPGESAADVLLAAYGHAFVCEG